ncbi:acryloyl-CoA reductase [Pelagibacterium luteolum]|uniref:Putative quinone oxidoreductase, YhdH/YhfP family n=1 Tax=Pelagibacterium luteolum TaxID=440168 RepID=A0A1G7UT83_9HYPH|nr:acryloyl-CoA reductase [Pelagibacterium luteolum]SDG50742.1 putative quinone oxidoreductase, YhdH/YhfP family [Pelagibacterium luteolum]
MSFRALVTDKRADGTVRSTISDLDEASLPEGNVLVGIDWAGFNYKDGMALAGIGGLVRNYPHIGGVDFAGRVIESHDERYHPGQAVVLTGWRVGEWHWGGFATRARVNADWLVPLPKSISTRDAMVLGTAGLTAMLAVHRLKSEGVKPGVGRVLVTGAGGGVGSMATLLLARSGYVVDAMTGRDSVSKDLLALGADAVVGRDVLAPSPKKLLAPRWSGAVDNVGGAPLGELLKQIEPGGCVASVGLAAGDGWDGSVVPFILRGVTMAGIDSVMQPYLARVTAWDRLASLFGFAAYEHMVTEVGLGELEGVSREILKGNIKGRVIVSPKR